MIHYQSTILFWIRCWAKSPVSVFHILKFSDPWGSSFDTEINCNNVSNYRYVKLMYFACTPHNFLLITKGWFPSCKISAVTGEFKGTDSRSLDFCHNLPCFAQYNFNLRRVRPCKVLTVWTKEHGLTVFVVIFGKWFDWFVGRWAIC